MMMQFEGLPRDPAMLLSTVNMMLRDRYNGSLDALCSALDVDRDEFLAMMARAGWEFNADAKKFW